MLDHLSGHTLLWIPYHKLGKNMLIMPCWQLAFFSTSLVYYTCRSWGSLTLDRSFYRNYPDNCTGMECDFNVLQAGFWRHCHAMLWTFDRARYVDGSMEPVVFHDNMGNHTLSSNQRHTIMNANMHHAVSCSKKAIPYISRTTLLTLLHKHTFIQCHQTSVVLLSYHLCDCSL